MHRVLRQECMVIYINDNSSIYMCARSIQAVLCSNLLHEKKSLCTCFISPSLPLAVASIFAIYTYCSCCTQWVVTSRSLRVYFRRTRIYADLVLRFEYTYCTAYDRWLEMDRALNIYLCSNISFSKSKSNVPAMNEKVYRPCKLFTRGYSRRHIAACTWRSRVMIQSVSLCMCAVPRDS